MEKVQGIGGFFFRAKNPAQLAAWYADNLGVAIAPKSYQQEPWRTDAGITVFAPFDLETEQFGDRRLQWMINFRVANLEAMATQLLGRGIAVDVDAVSYPNGRFAKLQDPDGNPIQLWEPREP